MRRPLVIAHRGASRAAAENTEAAFEAAIALGADMFEFDVRRTADGRLVAFHDAHLAGRPLREMTHAEIATARGFRPPLLEEVLELAAGRIGLDVELKEDGYVGTVVDAVRRRFPPAQVVITSFLDSVVAQARELWPDAPAGLLAAMDEGEHAAPDALRARVRACGATGVAPEHALVRRDGVDWAVDAGLGVFVWTVNDAAALRALLGDARIDAVITDVPDRAVALHPDAA